LGTLRKWREFLKANSIFQKNSYVMAPMSSARLSQQEVDKARRFIEVIKKR
jgi:hypothetical protein